MNAFSGSLTVIDQPSRTKTHLEGPGRANVLHAEVHSTQRDDVLRNSMDSDDAGNPGVAPL